MIKKKHISIDKIKQLFKEIKSFLPECLLSPFFLLKMTMIVLNDILMIMCYLMLIGQSARLLSKDQTLTDVKVLLFKWILMISFQMLFGQITHDNVEGLCIKFIFLLIIVVIIYPSKISKSTFKKYLSEDDKVQVGQQVAMRQSLILARSSLIEKVLQQFTIFLLIIVKNLLKFIHPINRKSIKQQIMTINLMLEEQKQPISININKEEIEKYKKIENQEIIKSTLEESKQIHFSIEQKQINKQKSQNNNTQTLFAQVKNLGDSTYEIKDQTEVMRQSSTGMKNSSKIIMKDTTTPTKSQLKYKKQAKRQRKYLVSQYLLLPNTSNRVGLGPGISQQSKRCTYYRQIQISYDIDSSVMTVMSLSDMKISQYNLDEILLLDDLMVQFQYQDSQSIIVKFKSIIQFEQFINPIDVHEQEKQKQIKYNRLGWMNR